ncbi:hypothetical protein F9B85_08070 [Heliorestis acidaminivorans]|uniref:Phosphoribosyltransferase n=2 Tax=Heliorestis acidaminivorans TaxID=553427 RepID=A0A6I0EZC4_9FIRM|nr:hypothetical protein F9B85_08070 [Heliorestis acidaminivorans]
MLIHILDDLHIRLTVTSNPYELSLESLFSLAARKNRHRSFLFVSKLLGKHIAIEPEVAFVAGKLLAQRFMEERARKQTMTENKATFSLPSPHIFIGFAETATALGHAVFSCFDQNAFYWHTTREKINELPDLFGFEEEHCHAPEHRLYGTARSFFDKDHPIVLIDDELTTGKSALNFIQAIEQKYRRKEYYILSILDWRSEEDRATLQAMEQRLGVSITVLSLLSGTIESWGAVTERAIGAYMPQEEVADPKSPLPQVGIYALKELQGMSLKNGTSVDVVTYGLEKGIAYTSIDSTGWVNKAPYLPYTGRFGITPKEQAQLEALAYKVGKQLQQRRRGEKALCLGTGEFMYLPSKIASYMGEKVLVQATTRSPVYPVDKEDYGIRHGLAFPSPDDPLIPNYVYNIGTGMYDEIFLFLERPLPKERIMPLLEALDSRGIDRICMVVPEAIVPHPDPMGSYRADDVVFLLKDLSGMVEEVPTEERERMIQKGVHYSEMLPLEYKPTQEYMDLFYQTLEESARKIAWATAVVAEKIIGLHASEFVLVSLARAGTPVGILIRRYLEQIHGLTVPHYSISIIRDKGIDEKALLYILQNHGGRDLQFVDGWTGKGAISMQLTKACQQFKDKYSIELSDSLAVLADPGYCAPLYGTREDYLIPSACLNATVSGLVSRTVYKPELLGPFDFHGARYYSELQEDDVSNLFVDTISRYFEEVALEGQNHLAMKREEHLFCDDHRGTEKSFLLEKCSWQGLRSLRSIQERFGIKDINLIKPGVGETTRVLLRRVPWRILVNSMENPNLTHILILARDRNVPVEVYGNMTYSCCGLIKPLEEIEREA